MEANRTRNSSPILVLGLPRTGTSSIRKAFMQLGYEHVYHMITVLFEHPEHTEAWNHLFQRKYKEKKSIELAHLDALVGSYDVLTDYPPSAFAPELIDLYPDAKVVLTKRDPGGWVESVKGTFIIGTDSQALPNIVAFVNPVYRQIWSMFQTIIHGIFPQDFGANGIDFYEHHNAEVRRLMASDPDRFLEFDVRQGWEPLCAFLNKPVPDTSFPRVNDSVSFRRNFKIMLWIYLIHGLKKYAIVGACTGMALVAWRGFNNNLLFQSLA